MCRIFMCKPTSRALARVRHLSLYSRDNSDAQSSNASALEFVVLVADCISVILAESDELGFSEEEALQIAAGYVSEVVPILMKGPWPPSTASTILQAASRIELEQVADKLRRLATVCNF